MTIEISVNRIGKYVSIQVADVFKRVDPQGLLITPDEASILRDKLGRALGEV